MYYIPAIACILAKRVEHAPRIAERASLSLSYRAAQVGFMAMTLFLGIFQQTVLRVIEQGLAVFG
jgi:hypothetical protein